MNRTPTLISGVRAGHLTSEARTGVTVLLFDDGAQAAVHVPGSATGTRELGVLAPGHLASRIHGLCLSGGSAFGLAAADGVLRVLEARGVGFGIGERHVVPIVPAAILFDLHTATARPDADMGAAAAEAASAAPLSEGRVGAGTGARVASLSGSSVPGGVGCWGLHVEPTPWHVAAVVAVNALGSVYDPDTGEWVAGGPTPPADATPELRGQTTLAAVVTDAPLSREGCSVVARMASAGFARTLFPAFTPFDGDVVFVAATGSADPTDASSNPVEASALMALGDAAATCIATAIVRGVRLSALAGT